MYNKNIVVLKFIKYYLIFLVCKRKPLHLMLSNFSSFSDGKTLNISNSLFPFKTSKVFKSLSFSLHISFFLYENSFNDLFLGIPVFKGVEYLSKGILVNCTKSVMC